MTKRRDETNAVRTSPWLLLCAAAFAAGCEGNPIIGGSAVLTPVDAPEEAAKADVAGDPVEAGDDVAPDATKDAAPDGEDALDATPARCATSSDCVGNPAGGACNPATGACQPACTDNASCAGNAAGPVCEVATGLCTTRCAVHADCAGLGGGDICSPSTHTCTSRCEGDADCAGHPAGGTCNPATGACGVPCRTNTDCVGDPAGAVCDPSSGLCSGTCRSHADCAGMPGGICSPVARTCVARCDGNADCAGHPDGIVCDTSTGACVQCVATDDTCAADQHCDPESNACVAGCRSDEGCPRDGLGVQLRCNVETRTCEACVTDAHCPTGQRCSGGACVAGCTDDSRCAAGEHCCDGACVDPRSNEQNCGACGRACAAPNGAPACTDGACGIARCAAPFGNCDGETENGCETNTNTSLAHCGRCGNACPARAHAAASCDDGACAFTCEPGFADCNGSAEDGCETDLGASVGNCGACGRACAAPGGTAACVAGACAVAACNGGFADCDGNPANGCEVDTLRATSHCGGCGRACPSPPRGQAVCADGACAIASCFGGYADCDGDVANGCEADLERSTASCGACGRACVVPHGAASCTVGVCGVAACDAGFADCDGNPANGCETDLGASPANCGACGRACSIRNGAAGCAGGACAVAECNPGFADCDGNPANGCEANLQADEGHCGGCGRACALPGGVNACVRGACAVTSCAAGLGDCDGNAGNGCEVALDTSLLHCGACGHACPAPANGTARCAGGACGVGSCNAGFADCDANPANGCEVSTLTSTAHCGACGRACPARPNTAASCAAGACAYACLAGFADCDGNAANGCEVDLRADEGNCGACGRACAAPSGGSAVCAAGVCGASCAAGQTDCSGTCRATASDVNHCGACGHACSFPNGTATCAAGTCTLGACATGFGNCDGNAANGCETDLRAGVSNCGACGHTCAAPTGGSASCTSGVCGAACTASQTNCSGVCRDLAEDEANCGACGRACGAGQACVNSTCVGQGQLRFTLTWDTNGDMDLHLLPPCGTEIYYSRTSACGGTLDVDNTSGRGPENIYWSSAYTPGTYQVCPEAYTSAVANANYTLTVVRGGTTVHTSSGRRGRTDGNAACSGSFPGVVTLGL
ncbi:MAG: hypothetical protein U0324_14920 [Polyangiales bacterium]